MHTGRPSATCTARHDRPFALASLAAKDFVQGLEPGVTNAEDALCVSFLLSTRWRGGAPGIPAFPCCGFHICKPCWSSTLGSVMCAVRRHLFTALCFCRKSVTKPWAFTYIWECVGVCVCVCVCVCLIYLRECPMAPIAVVAIGHRTVNLGEALAMHRFGVA
jgi:hypothetical protein